MTLPLIVRKLFRRRIVLAAAVLLAGVVLAALFAGVLSGFDPNETAVAQRLAQPSISHWLGTDELGRDLFTRIVFGGRYSLTIAALTAFGAVAAGTLMGLAAGFFRHLDAPLMRVVDAMMSFPDILLAIALVGILGPSMLNVVFALVLVFLLMALVLVIRPWGLMGRPDAGHGRVVLPEGILRLARFGQQEKIVAGAAAVLLVLLPWLGDAYLTKVAIEVLTFALAAFSLNFLIGVGGLVSFGHAAYFGLGAYGAGLLATRLGVPMEPALVAAPIIAGLGAALWQAREARIEATRAEQRERIRLGTVSIERPTQVPAPPPTTPDSTQSSAWHSPTWAKAPRRSGKGSAPSPSSRLGRMGTPAPITNTNSGGSTLS